MGFNLLVFLGKIFGMFKDRGINIRDLGAKCNANYKNPSDQKWYVDPLFTALADDDTEVIQTAIDSAPLGSKVIIPASSMISSQIVINKQIEIYGTNGRNKSANLVYGSRLVISSEIDQENDLESAILINASSVKIRGIALKGQGASYGSVGILCKSSNGAKIDDSYVEGFGAGVKMGQGSAHVSIHESTLTGNYDGVVFGSGNLFDFKLYDVLLDGNVRSGTFLEANTSVEDTAMYGCHMGWPTEYGILQDPATTTGDGYSGITLLDTPIEQVAVKPISIVNGGNIFIQGGYWTWTNNPTATTAFDIKNVTTGPIWFSPKLEPTYPNPNATSVINIPGYTNHPVNFWGALNGFAQQWVNYGASVDMKRVFVNGFSYGGQQTGVNNVAITQTTTDQLILSHSPLINMNFEVKVYARVTASTDLTLTIKYNNGAGVITKVIHPTAAANSGDDFSYSIFIRAEQYNQIQVLAKVSVANSARVSATIEPKPS